MQSRVQARIEGLRAASYQIRKAKLQADKSGQGFFVLDYLGLLLLFLLLFALNFSFALREWLRPEDDTPIPVDTEYVRSENYFGVSFRAKMKEWLKTARSIPSTESNNNSILAVLEKANGEKILWLAGGRFGSGNQYDELVYSEGDLYLGAHSVFHREIYGLGKVETAVGMQLQAVAADGDIILGVDNDVSRWVDARRKVLLSNGTVVHSRVSSMESIELEPQVSAQSLYAPLIRTVSFRPGVASDVTGPLLACSTSTATKSVGAPDRVGNAFLSSAQADRSSGVEETPPSGLSVEKQELPFDSPSLGEFAKEAPDSLNGIRCTRLAPDTLLVLGNLELPDGGRVFSNLIVKGTLRSGLRCCFNANVKAGRVELGAHNRVLENLISDSVIEVGESSLIDGDVAADQDIFLRSRARVGNADKQAVVSAGRNVTLESNIIVCGKVVAGRTIVTT